MTTDHTWLRSTVEVEVESESSSDDVHSFDCVCGRLALLIYSSAQHLTRCSQFKSLDYLAVHATRCLFHTRVNDASDPLSCVHVIPKLPCLVDDCEHYAKSPSTL